MSYPGQPYPMQPPMPPQPASGATAITAGVLAILGGLVSALGAILVFLSILGSGWVPAEVYRDVVLTALAAPALLVGAILMFVRKPAAQGFVTAGCVFILARVLLDVLSMEPGGGFDAADSGGVLVGVVFSGIAAAVTITLALAPLTSRYLKQPKAMPGASMPGMPPAPPFPPQQMPPAPQGNRPPLGITPPQPYPPQPPPAQPPQPPNWGQPPR